MKLVKYELQLVKEKTLDYALDGRKFRINSPLDAYKVATEVIELQNKAEEECWMFCLDSKGKIIGLHMVSRGSLNSSIVNPREVFKRALVNNASSIILLHNHPSGEPEPSAEDINITEILEDAGKILSIDVLDHIIVGDMKYVSLKERALM